MATQKETEKLRAGFAKLSNMDGKKSTPPIIQEVAKFEPPKKTGRKKHRLDGVQYVRISPALPMELKTEMDVAIKTTHRDYPTIDTFIAESVRVFLSMKK